MLKIKTTGLILVFILFAGCSPEMEGYRYLPTLNNAGSYQYGGWMVATVTAEVSSEKPVIISGELISGTNHLYYILDRNKMHVVPENRISKATLYLYRKQPGVFAIITIIGIIPNVLASFAYPDYSSQFLSLGIPALVFGLIFTASEAGNTRNQLRFPEKIMLHQFAPYARFPQGIPPGLDINQLKLPYVK